MADPAPVALSVTFDKPEGPPGEAHVKLYLADKLLADVGAALVAEAVVPVPGEVALPVDASVKQHGKTASEMRMPSYYVSMDCQASTVTYASGPVFNVSPGGSAQLVVKRK
eukprot:TRINITY_DN2029_c0_g1_i3.p1 TRINITY_DN2029_c0_g1~~TRINITY_DN2029_c0_g1_i3.p1  ORF type:complete len:111 (+),score=28.85 TRINITY_DN2029_c0_g1_i3:59-391(+)